MPEGPHPPQAETADVSIAAIPGVTYNVSVVHVASDSAESRLCFESSLSPSQEPVKTTQRSSNDSLASSRTVWWKCAVNDR